MKTEIAVSSGGVVFRVPDGGIEVALTARDNHGIWNLPKGLVEKGESLEKAALREVNEETGLTGETIREIDRIDYWFYMRSKNVRFHKFVHFFLMRHTGGDTANHDWEVEEVRWFPIDEAVGKLTYKSEKQVLRKAKEMIEGLVHEGLV